MKSMMKSRRNVTTKWPVHIVYAYPVGAVNDAMLLSHNFYPVGKC